ncbi:thiol reductant ABC exporter subunit CydC [Polymorphum gilvum]|uniref:ABC-type multidrug transport system, ATPase and permease component n=1 Tax=Polymorphum gilvum (strain LMG 25793 / CGMCC 1.9160 / SL003B-26A1) TaxID=991905 RepID=F2J6C3_POLGS|nr:thiol reductant ABC exporter subunit CydC [Polymorphum gilvum]ADZ71297.1 ABC-type multidrug transport system, ATPase and permease component [Polymorphum gilvum SL003B-26A1]
MKPIRTLVRLQYRESPGAFLLGLAMALVPALAGLALLGVAGWFITAAAVAGLAGATLNYFAPSALIRAFAIARTAGRYGERMITHDATFRFLAGLRALLFRGLAARPRAEGPGRTRSGRLLNRLTADIDQMDRVYLRLVVPAFVAAVALALVAGAALLLAPAALVAVAVTTAPIAGAASLGVGRALARDARRAEAAHEALRLRTVDLVAGRRDLAVYGGLEAAAAGIEDAGTRLIRAEDRAERREALGIEIAAVAGQIGLAAGLVLLLPAAAAGMLDPALAIGLLLVVLALPEVLAAILPGVAGLVRMRRATARVVPVAEAAARLPQRRPERMASQTGVQTGGQAPAMAADPDAPALELDAVCFAYPGAGRPVLDGAFLTLAPGASIALVGPSGCGKSTVIALAARLEKPDGGCLRLFGRPLEDWPEAELRRTVAVVGQKAYLFSGSVADNLRVADPAASDDALWQALDRAALGDLVRGRPDGLATLIGEAGEGLSGGEARRLALARAWLTRPRLWILDELTEGLDEATAAEVLASFSALRGPAAVLMISHRARETALAERVLRLTDGRIVAG